MQLPRLKTPSPLLQFLILFATAFLGGLVWYFLLYGRYPLYTSHVNWIYNAGGDALQHQLGWEFFRQEPWRFPLGTIQAYGYPVGTSVAFMDSIPLVAIPLKLLSPWLEPNFQYFGLWELSAIMGQMLLGMLILRAFTRSYPVQILGASLLVLSGPMIFRAFYHNSLSAHWILLAAIWFILLEYRGRLWRGAWVALFTLAILIHIYFIPMLVPLWMIGMFFHYRGSVRPWMAGFEVLAVAAALLLAGYAIGLFQISYNALASTGFGLFSWNLNGLWNPMHFGSQYVKELPRGNFAQYEGFSYLGLGILALLPVAVYNFALKEWSRRKLAFLLPFAAASLVYMLFALSHQAYFGETLLWELPLPQSLLNFFSMFRTSGRFIWPVFYFVTLFVIVVVVRSVRFPAVVLALALLLQFADLQPLYLEKRLPDFTLYKNQLQGEFWDAAADTTTHLVMIPNIKLPLEHEQVAVYAVHHGMTLNIGYFARADTAALKAYSDQAWSNLLGNRLDPRTIYFVTDEILLAQADATLKGKAYRCEVDGFTLFFSPEHGLASSGTDFTPYCKTPAP